MAKKNSSRKPKSTEPETTPRSVNVNVGGDMKESVSIIGDNNIVNYYEAVSANTTQNDPDYWNLKHPYPMPPNFTGRVAERAMLTQWLNDDTDNRLFILRALGGFGKSALTWHWLTHDVNPKTWTKVIFWSFYEGDASFEHFIEETLKYLKLEVPQGQRLQVDELLNAMQSQKILLIMDGFERVLRLYGSMNAAYQSDEEETVEENQLDCVNINAEWFLKGACANKNINSKILMTTRHAPRAIKPRREFMLGCREVELATMQKEDAVEFFRKQGVRGNRAEIEAACAPYGYHPLSLRILAGLIVNDREKPGDIAVASRLDIIDNVIANKHHVLEVSFNTLSPEQQRLLSNLACFRSSMKYSALKTISGIPSRRRKKNIVSSNEKISDGLQILENRGLLQWDRMANKYNLHPIVRRYAYDRLTASDRIAAHTRLVKYFDAVPKPEKVKKVEDLASVIELYHHMVGAGNLDEARKMYYERIQKVIYFQFGAYQLQIELLRTLFPDGEDKPPHLKREDAQAGTLNDLAVAHSLSGQPRSAIPPFTNAITLWEKAGDKKNLARGLGNMASMAQIHIGALNEAERNLRRQIDQCREIADEFVEANGHHELARVLSYCGKWQDAEQEQEQALSLIKKLSEIQAEGTIWSYRALRFLLMAKEAVGSNQLTVDSVKSAIECAQRALELADETTRTHMNVPRDYVDAYRFLGAAYRMNNDLTLAEENLSKALNLCRQINLVYHEADVLLDLARLRYAQGDFKDAQEKASEALVITERSGYVLQGADVNLFLAQYALEQEKDKARAKEYAESALKLAYCDGPPYYYKVAYEEAERMLEKLK
jgi:tetratricopeptide (TPR) repeat protein